MNWTERSLELRQSSHKTPAHSQNAHGCFVLHLPLGECWDPAGSLHTQQASIVLLYMGVFFPAMGQSTVMYTIPWRNVQVPFRPSPLIATNKADSLFSTAGPNCQESNYFNELPRYNSMPVMGLSRALLVYSYERTLWWSKIGKYWLQRSYLYLQQELLSFWGLWEIPERWKQ